MNILLLNAGSSSLKAVLMESADGPVLARGLADWAGSATRYHFAGLGGKERSELGSWRGHGEAVERFIAELPSAQCSQLTAVGHRVVHGGSFTSPVRVTAKIRSRLESLADLAPLHNPPSLEALAAAERKLPEVPHIAVFDTAFHATLASAAYTYPVPTKWTREWGIRRYGFHGLSHAYCARRAAEMLSARPHSRALPHGDKEETRLVICHLGHGCSASAVLGGQCVDTTMGFTPLDGLMMATRSGAIDPSIVMHVQQHHGLTPVQVETVLNRESGLLGVSGVSADMREVLAAAKNGNEQARLAVEIYARRVKQTIGALAATMGGVDALVFTAGVGEHSAEIRAAVCDGLSCLGLELDSQANTVCTPDVDVASHASPGRILVIATREDVTMYREVLTCLANEEPT